MKNKSLLLIACLSVLSIVAACNGNNRSGLKEKQNEDSLLNVKDKLKIMGIPITGTIDFFSRQLYKKEFKDKEQKRDFKSFLGRFDGEDAEIQVYFNEQDKMVYACHILINYRNSEDLALSRFESFKEDYMEKYNQRALYAGMVEDEGPYDFTLYPIEEPAKEGSKLLGSISIQLRRLSTDNYNYYIFIDYTDIDHITSNEKNLNDL